MLNAAKVMRRAFRCVTSSLDLPVPDSCGGSSTMPSLSLGSVRHCLPVLSVLSVLSSLSVLFVLPPYLTAVISARIASAVSAG